MKQTASEFFRKGIVLNSIIKENSKGGISFKIGLSKLDELSSESDKLEGKQSDDYAIDFAIWCDKLQEKFPYLGIHEFNLQFGSKSIEELLEIYKKEKGL